MVLLGNLLRLNFKKNGYFSVHIYFLSYHHDGKNHYVVISNPRICNLYVLTFTLRVSTIKNVDNLKTLSHIQDNVFQVG